jgi:hypothetical protein
MKIDADLTKLALINEIYNENLKNTPNTTTPFPVASVVPPPATPHR